MKTYKQIFVESFLDGWSEFWSPFVLIGKAFKAAVSGNRRNYYHGGHTTKA